MSSSPVPAIGQGRVVEPPHDSGPLYIVMLRFGADYWSPSTGAYSDRHEAAAHARQCVERGTAEAYELIELPPLPIRLPEEPAP